MAETTLEFEADNEKWRIADGALHRWIGEDPGTWLRVGFLSDLTKKRAIDTEHLPPCTTEQARQVACVLLDGAGRSSAALFALFPEVEKAVADLDPYHTLSLALRSLSERLYKETGSGARATSDTRPSTRGVSHA